MKVYVETNFVLELALRQEQHESCKALLRLAEEGRIRLVLPAFSLVEPYGTLHRHHAKRKARRKELDDELRQISRSAGYRELLVQFQTVTDLLIESTSDESKRLEEIRERLLAACQVIPLDKESLEMASALRNIYDFSPQDAMVCAAVFVDLVKGDHRQACFVNRDSSHFAAPDVIDLFKAHDCAIIPSFGHGLRYVQSRLIETGDRA